MITNNFNNSIKRIQTDYIPVAIFQTHEEADAFMEKCEEAFKDYTMYKNTNGETVVK